MSRVHFFSAEELMQPAFAGSRRRSLDLRSEADLSSESCSAPAAIRSRPGGRPLTRSASAEKKYCLKNSAVIDAIACDQGCTTT
jgi:hypothetical protein